MQKAIEYLKSTLLTWSYHHDKYHIEHALKLAYEEGIDDTKEPAQKGEAKIDSHTLALLKQAYYDGYKEHKSGDANSYTGWREWAVNLYNKIQLVDEAPRGTQFQDWELMLKSAIYLSLIGYSDSNGYSIPCKVRGQIEATILERFKERIILESSEQILKFLTEGEVARLHGLLQESENKRMQLMNTAREEIEKLEKQVTELKADLKRAEDQKEWTKSDDPILQHLIDIKHDKHTNNKLYFDAGDGRLKVIAKDQPVGKYCTDIDYLARDGFLKR